MPPLNTREHRAIPMTSAPPTYTGGSAPRKRPDGSALDRRTMDRHGLPSGPSHDRNGTADQWHEWQPGEIERSYSRTAPGNAAWYQTHHYGTAPGTGVKTYLTNRTSGPARPYGPPKPNPVAKAAKRAAQKASGR